MFLLAENANKRFKVNLRDVPAFLISGSPVNSSPERRWFGPHWLVLGPGSGCRQRLLRIKWEAEA